MLASQTRRLALGLAQQPWSLASNAGMAPALTMRLHGALAGTRVNEAGTFAGFATQVRKSLLAPPRTDLSSNVVAVAPKV